MSIALSASGFGGYRWLEHGGYPASAKVGAGFFLNGTAGPHRVGNTVHGGVDRA